MRVQELNLKTGTWLAVNCGAMPSESHCEMVMMAPANQKADLLDAAATHAASKHGEPDTPELRKGITDQMEAVEI